MPLPPKNESESNEPKKLPTYTGSVPEYRTSVNTIDPPVIVKLVNNRIKYLGHQPGEGELFKLKNRFKVEKEFYEKILELAHSYANKMKPAELYTAREMCGEEFWHSLRKWNRSLSGMCVADAVKREWLPFSPKETKQNDRSTRKYKILPKGKS